jgi:PD-(D/E)XK endonuclease
MNTRQKGDYSELSVLTELAKRSIRVAIPFGNSQGFDMLIETPGGWKTVQVKTAYRRGKRGNRIYVDTIRGTVLNKKRGYEDGTFDFLIAALPDERLFWIIPFDEMRGRRCLTLPDERDSNWKLLI